MLAAFDGIVHLPDGVVMEELTATSRHCSLEWSFARSCRSCGIAVSLSDIRDCLASGDVGVLETWWDLYIGTQTPFLAHSFKDKLHFGF